MISKNNKGQTLVEYLLLMAVITSVMVAFFKLDIVQNTIGKDGDLMKAFIQQMRYSYRHALPGKSAPGGLNYNSINHDSYYKSGSSRFFAPNDTYPDN